MLHLEQKYQGIMDADSAFRHVTAVHAGEHLDVPLLEFAALMASGAGSPRLTVAAFPSDDVLRILPSVARRYAEARGLPPPDLRLLTEPEVEVEFVSETNADLLVMRQAQLFARRTPAPADCSVCLLPSTTPARLSRILVCIDLNADGQDLLEHAARLYRAVGADEVLALHICCTEAYTLYGYRSHRTQRLKDLLHFLRKSGLPGVKYTPLLEESARPYRTLARIAAEQNADLVVVGRQAGEFSGVPGQLAADCGVPVLQLLLPKKKNGISGRLRRVFSNPEPTFG